MPERQFSLTNPGLVPTRPGHPLSHDPKWFDADDKQRLTVNEAQLRSLIRQEIGRALESLTAQTASGEDVVGFDVVLE